MAWPIRPYAYDVACHPTRVPGCTRCSPDNVDEVEPSGALNWRTWQRDGPTEEEMTERARVSGRRRRPKRRTTGRA